MGKYLKEFELISQYEEYINSDMVILPNVSIIKDDTMVHYNAIHDYSQDYLTFVAKEDGTFKFSGNSINYSVDNGETWTTLPSNTNTPTIQAGNKIMFKATLIPQNYIGIGNFSSTGKFTAQGNVMSLIYGDDFIGQKDLTGKDYVFYTLFNRCISLINAKNMSLPATILANHCYRSMFSDCTSLTTIPELPATTLASYCYSNMFGDCTSLTNVPELPVTTLTDYCYSYMFDGCTSLTVAPTLPATTLANSCYSYMFENCTSLITAPVLPATTLANNCYHYMFGGCTSLTNAPELPAMTLMVNCYNKMFKGCTSLTNAPELPATTLANNCYYDMFNGCTSLTNAPELPATTLTEYCYFDMFKGCTSLINAPELPATRLVISCYSCMFSGCTKLKYIKMLATNISATKCLLDWVRGASSTGTFVKHPNMTSLPTGSSGIPTGWTVQDAA